MMNLYLFNANDSAATYGIGSYLRELTQALFGADIHIHIVHLHAVCPEFQIEKSDGIAHWYVPEVRNQNTFSAPFKQRETYYRNVVFLLRRYIKDTSHLIFHFNYNQSQFLTKELKKVFDCKTVATVHFMKWMLLLQGNLNRFQALKSKSENQRSSYEQVLIATDEYEALQYNEVDRIIALSQHTKEILLNEYQLIPDKITVIPNGLDDSNLSSKNDRNSLRKGWRFSENELIILFVGRFHADKGLNFLIKAFHEVLELIPDCRLVIVGNGNYDTYISACEGIWTKVVWTGFLQKNKLYELYALADIGVMPSLHEQCSYVAIEMMMHDLPIIGASQGLKEMIVDEVTGLQIPVILDDYKVEIDSSSIAKKICYLQQNPKERQRMRQNGRKRYLQLYSSAVFRENMLRFYSSLFSS